MITEEMTLMALKYKSAKRSLGYTYYSDDAKHIIAIYDIDGNKVPEENHLSVMLSVNILGYKRIYCTCF